MLLTHTQPRPDLNTEVEPQKPFNPVHVLLALKQVRAVSPIKTVKVPR